MTNVIMEMMKEELKKFKRTTQQISNKINEIKHKGNWIESPYRQVVWIPVCVLTQDK